MYIDTDFPIRVTHFGRTTKVGKWHGAEASGTHLLIYVLEGSVKMSIESKTYDAKVGDVLLIPRNVIYAPVECDHIGYFYFHFNAIVSEPSTTVSKIISLAEPENNRYFYRCLNVSTVIDIPHYCPDVSTPAVRHIFKRLSQLNIWQHHEQMLLVNNLFQELLILLGTSATKENILHPVLRNITKYIDSHYLEDINLHSLSEMFNISTSYIARLFKTELNTTLTKYINTVRTSIACNLLLNTELSVREIAEQVGFNHQHYFNRVFQEIYHTTPGAFRRSGPPV